jgi:hypothetical protein
MCHRHLTADFGPKMNFLVGHNGSEYRHLHEISKAYGEVANLRSSLLSLSLLEDERLSPDEERAWEIL